jgi:hypothetical protein
MAPGNASFNLTRPSEASSSCSTSSSFLPQHRESITIPLSFEKRQQKGEYIEYRASENGADGDTDDDYEDAYGDSDDNNCMDGESEMVEQRHMKEANKTGMERLDIKLGYQISSIQETVLEGQEALLVDHLVTEATAEGVQERWTDEDDRRSGSRILSIKEKRRLKREEDFREIEKFYSLKKASNCLDSSFSMRAAEGKERDQNEDERKWHRNAEGRGEGWQGDDDGGGEEREGRGGEGGERKGIIWMDKGIEPPLEQKRQHNLFKEGDDSFAVQQMHQQLYWRTDGGIGRGEDSDEGPDTIFDVAISPVDLIE